MKSLNGLLKPIPFLMKYPVLHEKYFPDNMYTLQLRPYSIMEDTSTIYSWINKPRILCSGHIRSYQRNMLKYYKNILDSSDSQTFMILKEGLSVCQVDLLQAETEPAYASLQKSTHNLSLRYLADFRTPSSVFRNALHLCLEYIFSFSEVPVAFTSLEPSGIITEEEFTALGFKYIDAYFSDNEMIRVFSCENHDFRKLQ